jgi:MarR family transcriptional regulator, 2-MHQ and catechol-resistance regulon repressor
MMGNISEDIQSNFSSNKLKAFINIKYTANWLNSLEIDFFKPYGLSPQQYNILRILRGAKSAVKVQLVKERMIERSPNITRLMDKLLEKNLINRNRSDSDRRVVFVEINESGLNLLKKIDKQEKLDFLDNLTENEASLLTKILDKIR